MQLFHLCLGENKKMEQYNTHYIELSEPYAKCDNAETSVSRPTGLVHSGIAELDGMLGGLYIGQMTAFIGRSKLLSSFLHRICVKTFDMFHSPTIVLDAGNQLNPFLLARFARLNMLSHQELLNQVYLSRAYTVYQLTDLIQCHVEPLIHEVKPVTLVLTGLFSLLNDADVSREETTHLLQLVLERIKQITTTYQLATVIIDKHNLDYVNNAVLFDALVDTTVKVKDMRHCPRITITQRDQQVTITSETFGQLCLQDFGMVI